MLLLHALVFLAFCGELRCSEMDAGTSERIARQARICVDLGEARPATFGCLREWRKSTDPPIKLDSTQRTCVRDFVDKLLKRRQGQTEAAKACETERLAPLLVRYEAMKSSGQSRSQALGSALRRTAPANPKVDQQWESLGSQMFCEFALVDLVFGPPKPQRRVRYDRESLRELRIPKDMIQRFREIAKGVCAGPNGLNAVANLHEILSSRDAPTYTYEEIRGLTLGLRLSSVRTGDQDWLTAATQLECYFALISFAENLESVNPPPRPPVQKVDVGDSEADEDSPEYKLALLNEPTRIVQTDDPVVRRFGHILESLSAQFSLSKADVGGKIYAGWEFVVDAGIDITVLQFAEEIQEAGTHVSPADVNFDNLVATYVVLRRAKP